MSTGSNRDFDGSWLFLIAMIEANSDLVIVADDVVVNNGWVPLGNDGIDTGFAVSEDCGSDDENERIYRDGNGLIIERGLCKSAGVPG